MKILVVGAGIGGLAFAAAMRDATVTVVERAEVLRPIRAGLILHPNAMAGLASFGADARPHAWRIDRMTIADESGAALQTADMTPMTERFGGTWAIHRAALHEVLLAAVPDDVAIRLGTTVTALADDADGVDVTFSDGRQDRYDLVIGADGIRSAIRGTVLGDADPAPIYSGYTGWRAVVPCPEGADRAIELWGRGSRFGLVPLGDGRAYVFFVRNAPRGEPSPGIEGLRAMFAEYGEPVRSVLAALTDDALLHHDLDELPHPVWGRSRVWLIGDAAHAMTPNFGQGAAQAIEDAVTAARMLDRRSPADVPEAFDAWVRRRHPRVARLQAGARRFGEVAQWQGGVAVFARSLALRCTPAWISDWFLNDLVAEGVAAVR